MLFSSLTFLFFFLPIVLFFYFIIKNRKYRNFILLGASLGFYAWGEPKYVVIMIFSIVANYIIAYLIDKFRNNHFWSKTLLIGAIIMNCGMLFLFKYFNFFIQNINHLFGKEYSLLSFVLPIGISFYTFQILSYVIDVYTEKVKVQKNILNLGTYIALFPQLIAGPIVRYETINEELSNRKENITDAAYGFRRFMLGFCKKVIIANNMAIVADVVFNADPTTLGTIPIWIGALAYTFQIYFDFSGYSDMAIGLGRVFGFHFLENFDFPYISKSITEFWRRWHISLSSWFRDYVYIPLGGNRTSKWKWIRNIIIVWMLTGLWHGASWNYLIWGIYYAILLLLEKLWFQKQLEKLPNIIAWGVTFVLITIGWVIFRVEDVSNLCIFLQKMFVFKPIDLAAYFIANRKILYTIPYFLLAICCSGQFIRKLLEKIWNGNSETLQYGCDILLIICFMIGVSFLVCGSYNPFIYFRF